MVFYIESNIFGIIIDIYCYVNNSMLIFCDNIYGGQKIFGYIEGDSKEIAVKKYRELLLKKLEKGKGID